ncbi:MotB family protein [Afifella sp. H1R]|uniref:MotB family protein n=1 Tax=Afifella sp. H1R TaxID=2908841 RepID=UPI001F34DFDA|nr:MotB family protein [Afifella sp. H1R]MCF1503815.1 MotB family protein [Afifella sp. H1R]
MSDDAKEHQELIIIKRYEDEEHESHSSAWKVAHADFMTAMMAFFLIMWLINVTDEEVKKSIANYFNPVKLSASITDRKGLNNPEEIGEGDSESRRTGDGDERGTPGPLDGGHGQDEEAKRDAAAHEEARGESAGGADGNSPPLDRPATDATMTAEQAAFSDPYLVLAELADEVPPADPATMEAPVGETGIVGVTGGEVYRDPFDPVYWQMQPASQSKTKKPGDVKKIAERPSDRQLDAAAASEKDIADASYNQPVLFPQVGPGSAKGVSQAERVEAAQMEAQLQAELKKKLGELDAPNISVQATPEGILISLTDEMDFSMFEIGSAIPKPVVVVAMESVSELLVDRPGDIVVRGYTDGRPFRSPTYDNWRLSTARAHMAYYMLTRGRLAETRIRAIEGFADRNLKNPEDPNAAENRRIEILLKEPA